MIDADGSYERGFYENGHRQGTHSFYQAKESLKYKVNYANGEQEGDEFDQSYV